MTITGFGILAAATWYVLPVFSGNHGDVAVWGGGSIESSIDTLSFELRDRGRGVQWAGAGSTWCELADVEPSTAGVDVVVLAPEANGTCAGDAVAAAIGRWSDAVEVVVVPLGGATAPTSHHATVIDAEVLLGTGTTTSMPCEWWDSCQGDVAVRGPDGELTEAGRARLARMISAAIG